LMTEKLGAAHRLIVAPACGHDARCVFTHDVALPVLVPGP
jgi:hypothetical protein